MPVLIAPALAFQRPHGVRACKRILSALSLLVTAASHAQGAIRELPSLGTVSEALAASRDGSVIVGWVEDANGVKRACRWDHEVLQVLPWNDRESRAVGVSADGTIVVGYGKLIAPGVPRVPLKWVNGVATQLPRVSNCSDCWGQALGISADGSTIVGASAVFTPPETYECHPVTWRNGTLSTLPAYSGIYCEASACTADGSIVAGVLGPILNDPVRWTNSVRTSLPSFGNNAEHHLLGISADGRMIVGSAIDWNVSATCIPLKWVDGALSVLEGPFGPIGKATGISDDGATIVGWTYDPSCCNITRALRWVNGQAEFLPEFPGARGYACLGVSGDGTTAVGAGPHVDSQGSYYPRAVVWDLCPNTLAGGQCNAPPYAANLPFEGRVVTDPDHPLDFTLQIADNDPAQAVTLELDPTDVAALTSIGYSVQITHHTNPATVHVWQKTSLDLGWAEREWRLRINASDDAQASVQNPIELFVHRRSFLPPRRLLDGHPSTLTPLAQWDARWGFQRTGATDDTATPALDLIRDWVSGVRADLAAIPLQNAGEPVDSGIVQRWFTSKFVADTANWIDQPVLVATGLSLTSPGAGGEKAEQVWSNVPLQYVSGPRATAYPHANITTRGGSVVTVELIPTERGTGFEAPSGTVLTALPSMIGDVVAFVCTVSATTPEPNGVRGDKNDILEIARLVEARRPNNNLRLIGCCLTSCMMAGNAVMTGELPQVAHEWTPGEAHAALRTPALAWMTRPGPTETIKLDRWRGSETANAVPGPGPRFINGFCVVWDQINAWFNSQGAPIKLVRWSDGNPMLTAPLVREHLDLQRALVFFNGEHWRMISKYDFGGANGELRVFVSDPGSGTQQWLTLAQAGGTSLRGFATVELNATTQQFNAQATDFEAYATGAARILVTDPSGRKAGIDPATGSVFGDATSGIAFDAPLDFPGYAPLSDAEWAQRTAESLRRVTMTGAVPTGTYVIDVDDANTPVNIAWRQAGQPVHSESIMPTPTKWGGRAVVQVTVVSPCPADLNGDGAVGPQDITILLNSWGATGPADLNHDGVVGPQDITILLSAWGGC